MWELFPASCRLASGSRNSNTNCFAILNERFIPFKPENDQRETMDKLLGKDGADSLRAIVISRPEIVAVSLIEYLAVPLLQERIPLSHLEQDLTAEALRLRSSLMIPFWDAIMASCVVREQAPERLLDAALFHQSSRGQELWLCREAVLDGELQRVCSPLRSYCQIAITSEVRNAEGSVLHIPLLDLHCPPSAANLRLAESIARRLLPDGAIVLESGKSYHLQGVTLVGLDALIDFLSRALLFSPIVDRAYIAHQLLERRCALRLSSGGEKARRPKVVRVLI
jgi:hypothetical protein